MRVRDGPSHRRPALQAVARRDRGGAEMSDVNSGVPNDSVINLTPKQRTVVELLVAGHRVHAIARRMNCTEATVRAHIQAVSKQLPGPHPPMHRILVHYQRIISA